MTYGFPAISITELGVEPVGIILNLLFVAVVVGIISWALATKRITITKAKLYGIYAAIIYVALHLAFTILTEIDPSGNIWENVFMILIFMTHPFLIAFVFIMPDSSGPSLDLLIRLSFVASLAAYFFLGVGIQKIVSKIKKRK